MKLQLSVAMGDYDRTRALFDGRVQIDGVDLYSGRTDVVELRRNVGMVFQKSNPFPMSIYENVVYPLRIDGEVPNLGKFSACRRVARAIYMGSAPTTPAKQAPCVTTW